MPLVNCKKCGKAFGCVTGNAICPECREIENQNFEKVRNYVRDNPGTPVDVVAEETGIPGELIRQYLNEGRLTSQSVSVELNCQLCGKSISSGNYCMACMDRLKKGLKTKQAKVENKKKETKTITQKYFEDREK